MAGDWIKIEHALAHKPEVMQLAAILGIDEMAVVGHLVCFWCWVDQNMSPECPAVIGTRSGLDRVAQRDGFVDAMQQVGWLGFDDSGRVLIPNYEAHLSKSAKTRALEQRKKNRQREKSRKCPEGVPQPSGQKRGPDRDQRREESIISGEFFNPSPSEEKQASPRSPKTAQSHQEAFEHFWRAYPEKASKQPAAKAFAKAFGTLAKQIGTDGAAAKLVQAAEDYRDFLASHPSPPKAKYAQGWLNDARYEDDYTELLDQARRSSPSKADQRQQRNEDVFDAVFGTGSEADHSGRTAGPDGYLPG